MFRTLGSRSLSVTTMLNFSGKANTSIHGLKEDDTARLDPCCFSPSHPAMWDCLSWRGDPGSGATQSPITVSCPITPGEVRRAATWSTRGKESCSNMVEQRQRVSRSIDCVWIAHFVWRRLINRIPFDPHNTEMILYRSKPCFFFNLKSSFYINVL